MYEKAQAYKRQQQEHLEEVLAGVSGTKTDSRPATTKGLPSRGQPGSTGGSDEEPLGITLFFYFFIWLTTS